MESRQCLDSSVVIYSDKQLERKMRLERLRWPLVWEDTPTEHMCRCVGERRMSALMRSAKLTPLERRVFIFRVHGATLRQIAGMLGISRQRLCHTIKRIEKKLAHVKTDRYYGLHEVYWQEVRRYVYRRPAHLQRNRP